MSDHLHHLAASPPAAAGPRPGERAATLPTEAPTSPPTLGTSAVGRDERPPSRPTTHAPGRMFGLFVTVPL